MKWYHRLAVRFALNFLFDGLAGCSGRKCGHDLALGMRLDEVLNARADSGATYTARVVDLSNGRELYARDIVKPVIPASNMKLFVSAAALDLFGPEHAFV